MQLHILNLILCCQLTPPFNELCDKTGDVRFAVLKCGLSKFRPLRHDARYICSTGSVSE